MSDLTLYSFIFFSFSVCVLSMEEKRLLEDDQSYIHSLEVRLQQMTSQINDMKAQIADMYGCCERVYHSCPDGYMLLNHSCYRIHHNELTWPEAITFCKTFGAHLLVLETPEEHNVLKEKVKEVQGSYHGTAYWVAASDANVEGQWIWAGTEQPANLGWGPGEPNAGDAADCACLWKGDNYDIADENCHQRYNFICEVNLA